MKEAKFVLRAQALDNKVPDPIEDDGELIDSVDLVRRQQVASLLSTVGRTGERIFDHGRVRLTANNSHFVAEIVSVERDCLGRLAPIICYGEYVSPVDDLLGVVVAQQLERFAARMERTLESEDLELVPAAFETLKRKQQKARIVKIGSVALFGMFVAALLFWVTHWLRQSG